MCWYNNNSVKIGYKNNYAHPYFNPPEDSNWYEGNEIWKNRYTNQNKYVIFFFLKLELDWG